MERDALRLASPDLLRDRAYIGGEWVSGHRAIAVSDPADGTAFASVPNLDGMAAETAVTAAHAAFADWRDRPSIDRADILLRWHDAMIANQDDLACLLTAEQGKPLGESLGEVIYAASFLRWFAEEARRVDGYLPSPHRTDRRIVVTRKPVGVVAAITPWNFPLAMITRKAGPALAAGCTMVLKPSELTPLSALALARLAEQADVPAGVFNVVTGDAEPIGQVMTTDPRVRKLSFTGSTAVGKRLAAQCMSTVKRVSLELGGNAPFIVMDDADLDEAVMGGVAAKYRNAGQTCVCANRFLVQAGIYEAFAEKLVEAVGRLRVGSGFECRVDQGPLINEAAVAKVQRHVDDAVRRGGTIIAGGTSPAHGGGFFSPTIIRDVPPSALLCHEETFGPVAGLVQFETEAEALAMANDSEAGLAAYLYTRDLDRGWRMSEALDYGMVGLNTGLISTEIAPFGGIKQSGIGREGSRHGIDEYLDFRSTCLAVN